MTPEALQRRLRRLVEIRVGIATEMHRWTECGVAANLSPKDREAYLAAMRALAASFMDAERVVSGIRWRVEG